ncbi:MAG: copper homeostasis protein CutC [Spirosomaceae bacterium]|jgi:copper homeostasis protein|nr:copper homeostasis protein CutC [Spirosomataceae bacterium]
MDIEVCAFSIESCLNAQQAGARRVELCAGLYEGGTTPSHGMIARARQLLQIQLYVMIRPRGGDFCYDEEEFEVMRQDIQTAKNLGADGVVFGILNPDGTIDVKRNAELVQWARPMGVTFHRAFDRALAPLQALEDVIQTGAERILTSGQQPTAIAGRDLLKTLVNAAAGRIEIMAGAGVNSQNALSLAQTGAHALHLTGKTTRAGQMTFKNTNLTMASVVSVDEDSIVFSSVDNIEAVKNVVG